MNTPLPHNRSQHRPCLARPGRSAIVMCASIPWGFHRNRQQELAIRLSELMPVVYVEPPRAAMAVRQRRARLLPTTADNCHVVQSPTGIPGDRVLSLVNRAVQRRLGAAITDALAQLHLECAVLWIDRIESAPLIDMFRGSLVVYDCVDEEWTFGRLRWRSYLQRLEESVAARADLVIASSNALRNRLSEIVSRAELVPNGCDYQHFSQSACGGARPAGLPAAGVPLIGFIGGVTRRALDYALLQNAFAQLPSDHFVFVGSYDAASKRVIAGAPNATLLGSRPYDELPAYLSSFDVAIIPYLVGRNIDYVYPKKLHEYLAAGKPVVATDLPEIRAFQHVVRIARSPAEFVRAIEECVREACDPVRAPEHIARRRAVAWNNTWEKRVRQIADLLDIGICEYRSSSHLCSARDHA